MSYPLFPSASSTTRIRVSRCTLALLVLFAASLIGQASAQSSSARDSLRAAMGSNIETFSILGSDRSMSSGHYTSKLNTDNTLDITRIPLRWESKRLYDVLGLQISPVIRTGFAWGEADSTITRSPLNGDHADYESALFNLGLGGRIHLFKGLSLTPSFDVIYANTTQDFTPRSDAGRLLDRNFSGELVNWDVDSLTYAPKIDLTYRHSFGPVDFRYTLAYGYFQTDVVSGDADFDSDSSILANIIGLEAPLGFSVLQSPMRTEVEFSRSETSGGIEQSLRTDHLYNANLALFTRESKYMPLFSKIGIDGGYTWADSFDGWSLGLTGSIDFERFVAMWK